VKNQGNMEQDLLIITFDDKKTTDKIIINELKKGGFIAKGKPIYWKKVKTP
jgi:hypothetical protein